LDVKIGRSRAGMSSHREFTHPKRPPPEPPATRADAMAAMRGYAHPPIRLPSDLLT